MRPNKQPRGLEYVGPGNGDRLQNIRRRLINSGNEDHKAMNSLCAIIKHAGTLIAETHYRIIGNEWDDLTQADLEIIESGKLFEERK